MTPNPIDDVPGSSLPHRLEAELAVLGSMLLSPIAYEEVVQYVSKSCFFNKGHQQVFQCIQALHDRGEPNIDHAMLARELENQKALGEFRSQRFFEMLSEQVFSLDEVIHQARIVQELWIRRNLINACQQIVRESLTDKVELDCLLHEACYQFQNIQGLNLWMKQKSFSEIVGSTFARLLEREDCLIERSEYLQNDSGLCDLTRPDLRPGEVQTLEVSQNTGGMSLLCSMAYSAARAGKAVLIYNLRGSCLDLVEQILCMHTGVSIPPLLAGTLTEDQLGKLLESMSEISDLPIIIDDTSVRNASQIAAAARKFKRLHDIQLILIGGLYSTIADDSASPNDSSSSASQVLERLAKELDVSVISQVPVYIKPEWVKMLSSLND